MKNLGTIKADKDIITKDYVDRLEFLSGYSICSDISLIPITKSRCIVTLEKPNSSLTYTLGLNLYNNQDLPLGDTILVTVSVSGLDEEETNQTANIAIPDTINNKKVFCTGMYAPRNPQQAFKSITIGGSSDSQTALMLLITRDNEGYYVYNLNTRYIYT